MEDYITHSKDPMSVTCAKRLISRITMMLYKIETFWIHVLFVFYYAVVFSCFRPCSMVS